MEIARALTARPGWTLAAFLLLDAAALAFGAARGWDVNPFLTRLHGDALEYWEWAGRIAAGGLVGDLPFLSAPLYPYFLGALRALGAGLPAVFAAQILLRAGTAALLFRIGARETGRPGAGLAAAALFLLLAEPAFFATRVTAGALQLFLLAWLLDTMLRLGERRGAWRLLGLGALAGANVLANPPMLLLAAALPPWLGWRSRASWRALGLVAAGGALALAPATLHNALATRGSPGGAEFILVSAQSGVTFAHGNAPGAIGVYRAIPGVSQDRRRQNLEAYALAARATGEPGWRATDRFFRAQGLDWIRTRPDDAALLFARKAGFLLFGQDYGDLYAPALEHADAELPRPVPAPFGALPTAWLLPAAFGGAWLLARERRRAALPALALLAIPCVTVLLFFYSPRYRLPLVVPACLLAPCALRAAVLMLPGPRGWLALAALAGAPLLGRAAMLGAGLDDAARFRPEFEFQFGVLRLQQGGEAAARGDRAAAADLDGRAALRFERALELGHSPADSAEFLGRARLARAEQGDPAEEEAGLRAALEAFGRALAEDPERLDSMVDAARAWQRLAGRHGDPGGLLEARALLQSALQVTVGRGDEARSATLRRMLAALDAGG